MQNALASAIYSILKPLIRLLISNGVSFGEFSNLVKQTYVEVVEKELKDTDQKVTTSRIAIVTGLTRKEVGVIRKQTGPVLEQEQSHQKNRAIRVISAWISDPLFCEQAGEARKLQVQGKSGSFEQLVARFSGDMPYRAMLDELVRIGAVNRIGENEVELVQTAWIPTEGEEEKYHLLGEDVAALLATINHNILNPEEVPRYQRKVCYDRIPVELLSDFREFSGRENQKLLVKLNEWLAQRDMDRQSVITSKHAIKIGVGVYSFEDD